MSYQRHRPEGGGTDEKIRNYVYHPSNCRKREHQKIVNNFNEIFVNYNSEVQELKELGGLKDLAYEIEHHKKKAITFGCLLTQLQKQLLNLTVS